MLTQARIDELLGILATVSSKAETGAQWAEICRLESELLKRVTTAPNEIMIHLGESGWLATYRGPHAAEIVDLFDSATIPTAYTARAPLSVVIAEIQARNPGARVAHWADCR